MYVFVLLPLALSVLFGVLGPGLCRRLAPAPATWLLSVGAMVAAGASTLALLLISVTLLGRFPDITARGHWADAVLNRAYPAWLPLLSTTALVVMAGRFATTAVRRGADLHTAHRLAAAMPATVGELVVTPVGTDAYALPGRPGRIVIARGLLSRLSAAERRAVLAHERAHLRHHHHLQVALAELAAAANPLLYRLPAAVALSVERWADEEAALSCSRSVVARALRLTAERSVGLAQSPLSLAAASIGVVARMSALAQPAPRPRLGRTAVVLALLVAVVAASLNAGVVTDHVFDLAQLSYRQSHHIAQPHR